MTPRPVLIASLALALATVAVSRFAPTVRQVTVLGNDRLDREEVLAAADVAPGDPLLWITRWRVAGLERDPWVHSASVTRHWPDAVSIVVQERRPVLGDGRRAWAADGTELPGAEADPDADLPLLTGWGEPRLDEALELVRLLEGRGLRVISYTPEGFDIALDDASLFTPSAAALRDHWAAFTSQRGRRVAVYPWGVSNGND